MKNWFTTITGALAALGTALSTVPGTLGHIATYITAAALALLGVGSKDSNNKN